MSSQLYFNNKLIPTILLLGVFSILAIVVIWPIPLHIEDSIIGWPGDPLLQTWALCWNANWLSGNTASYFDANICHPEKTTFAFHDPLFVQGLLFFPIYLISGNPILGYNLMILLTYILGGWGMYLCGRIMGLSVLASFLSGVLFSFNPIRLNQLVHLNILSTQWLPFSIFFLLLLFRQNRFHWINSLGFALSSLLCFLSSFYHGLLWSVAVGIIIIGKLIKRTFVWQQLLQIFLAGILVAVAIAPFVLALYEVSERYDKRRTIETNIKHSARPDDFLRVHRDSLLYGWLMKKLPSDIERSGEKRLFPGFAFILFSVIGTLALIRNKKFVLSRINNTQSSITNETTLLDDWRLILVVGIAGIVLCLGPAIRVPIGPNGSLVPLPYLLLYKYVPAVQGLRVPARLITASVLCGALLAGLGFDYFRHRIRIPCKSLLALSLIIFSFLEGLVHNQQMTSIPTGHSIPDVYRDLTAMDESTVLLELPTDKQAFYPMYYSTYHLKKLANGRSAFVPPVTDKLNLLTGREWVDAFSPALLEHLLQTGVNTILVKRSLIEPKFRKLILQQLNKWNSLHPIKEYTNRDLLFRVDANYGSSNDVHVVKIADYIEGGHTPIELSGEDAYQLYLGRPIRREVVKGDLSIFEKCHLRWLVKIPKGIWRLQLDVCNNQRNRTIRQTTAINMRLADKPILEKQLNARFESFISRPVRVTVTAHYQIDCWVLPEHARESINIALSGVRLTPLADKAD